MEAHARLAATIGGITNVRIAMSALEMTWYMRNQLLRDADWAGMAHSVEIRVPLLDMNLLKSTVGILTRCSALTKARVVQSIAPNLPRVVFDRPKSGFSIPVHEWTSVRGRVAERGLRGWAKTVYASAISRI
jgi:asparagine synthase (glutamine-hydrolysing)